MTIWNGEVVLPVNFVLLLTFLLTNFPNGIFLPPFGLLGTKIVCNLKHLPTNMNTLFFFFFFFNSINPRQTI